MKPFRQELLEKLRRAAIAIIITLPLIIVLEAVASDPTATELLRELFQPEPQWLLLLQPIGEQP